MRHRLCLCLVILLLLTMAGCSDDSALRETDPPQDGRLKVAATIFPYYDFVRQIAGDSVDLTLVIPAGMDSHSFEPTPAQMLSLRDADVVICNGGTMELWVQDALEAVENDDRTVVTMMDYLDILEEEVVEGMEIRSDADGEEMEIEYDEHIWTSPVNAMTIASVIADTLAACDPENASLYMENLEEYESDLAALDDAFRGMSDERVRNMMIVAGKFPFRYLADTYHLEYRAAFTGCSTDTEPSAHTIAYLIDKVRDEDIPVIYYPELSSTRVADIIAEETGAEPLLLHSCHNVTKSEFDAGATYISLMTQNLENLKRGIDQ